MSTTKTTGLQCMGCGTPIKSGFFCPKCEKRAQEGPGADRPAGSRFTGQAGAQKKKQALMEDVTRLLKRVGLLVIIGCLAWFGWAQFGDRIMAMVHGAQGLTEEKERYDPTKDAQVVDGEGSTEAQRRKTFGVEKVEVEGN